jgi:hypothetical protein
MIVAQLVNKFLAPIRINSVGTLSILKIHFNNIFPSMPRYSEFSPLQASQTKFCTHFSSPMYATGTSLLTILDSTILTVSEAQYKLWS